MTAQEACRELYQNSILPVYQDETIPSKKKFGILCKYVPFMLDAKKGRSLESLRERYRDLKNLIEEVEHGKRRPGRHEKGSVD